MARKCKAHLTISLLTLAALMWGCGSDNDEPAPDRVILFAPETNRLNAYAPLRGGVKQTVIPSHADDPVRGRDINGQVCFPRGGSRMFIAGEDTNQPNPPPGWGVFRLRGSRVGELSAEQVGRLVPTYQPSGDNPENYGCGFLSDGRLVTTDIGNEAGGDPTGQLILWFPPLTDPNPRYCKLDVAIGTAQGIYVDEQDRVFVASAREAPGIYVYEGPFPTGNDAAHGCGRVDRTGAPLVDVVAKRLFIPADSFIRTPSGVVWSPRGTFYVSSVLNGVIAEYRSDGSFVRRIVEPVRGESLPFPSTGTPLGLALDSLGTLYYADLGLRQSGLNFGPGAGLGSVRQVRFVGDQPQSPETLDRGLSFPDGVGIWEPDRGGEVRPAN